VSIPIYRPYVFLRCRKCCRKTDHVLIDTTTLFRFGKGEIEEIFECQQCGEIKKIYEFATLPVHSPVHQSVNRRLQEPQQKPEVREKVEKEQKKDYMEVTIRKRNASFSKLHLRFLSDINEMFSQSDYARVSARL